MERNANIQLALIDIDRVSSLPSWSESLGYHPFMMYLRKSRRFLSTTRFGKKRTQCDTCLSNTGPGVVGRRAKSSSARIARGVNQQSYGGPITIRRALISHNAPFFLLRADHGRSRSDGLHVADNSDRGRSPPADRLPQFLNKFSRQGRTSPSFFVYGSRLVWQKFDTDARKDESIGILAGDQLYIIRCAGSVSYVTLFAPFTCPLRNKTVPFSQRKVRSS